MVYCGSGTETKIIFVIIILNLILWSTAEAVLRRMTINFLSFFFMILWSTAEAVLRPKWWRICLSFSDPMVYCGSGTETSKLFNIIILVDPMVYCGSGTETP